MREWRRRGDREAEEDIEHKVSVPFYFFDNFSE